MLFRPATITILTLALAGPASAQASIMAYPALPQGVTSLNVLDRNGRPVGRILPQQRYWTTLDRIPEVLRKALLAVEDARFYEHGGIDLRGIARAFLKDVSKGRMAEGGSTITQQLIKNKYVGAEVSLDRKVKEARMAMDFEKTYSKNQILEMYFNEIYFGNGAWGISQAARLYFDKSPEALSPAECVALAGVPKNPGRYNPLGPVTEVAQRRDVVLKRMVDLNLISDAQRQELRAQPAIARSPGLAPQYLAYLRGRLAERFGPAVIEQGGLDVFTSLDLNLQRQAEQALREGVRRRSPDLQGALLCLDPATGDVLAAVGDVESQANALNRAFAARRQPGSAIKPLIYAAALEQGITAASLWNDAPVAYPGAGGAPWKPQNYGREQFGELSLRQALAHSSNVVTVKVLDKVGVPAFLAFASRMGLPLRPDPGLSLALGTEEVTLKDLVQAYTPLAGMGQRAEARVILRTLDRRTGAWTEAPPVLTPALDPAVACVATHLLGDVLTYGTAKGLKAFAETFPSAGKTGTTESFQDAWFVGYTPQLLAGVWVGHDRPRPEGRGFTGGLVAAPIWERFMRKAMANRPAMAFPQPESVVKVSIDPTTGQLATPACPEKLDEYFVSGTEPTVPCTVHGTPEPAPPAADPTP